MMEEQKELNTAEAPVEEAENGKQKKKKEKIKKPLWREILEWIGVIVGALAVAFVIRSFIFEPVMVDGQSMMDTLLDREIMIVTKFDYNTMYLSVPFFGCPNGQECTCPKYPLFGNPKRFDVVVCRYPNRGDINFVKRVIGLPGDTVRLENGYISIKAPGETEYTRYEEPYINESYRSGGLNVSLPYVQFYYQSHYQLNEDGSFTVPEGEYFVIGDHRNNSNDSRIQGPITRDMIVGKVAAVVWPLNRFRSIPNGLDVQ